MNVTKKQIRRVCSANSPSLFSKFAEFDQQTLWTLPENVPVFCIHIRICCETKGVLRIFIRKRFAVSFNLSTFARAFQ